ncbi:MAG TPA: tetratricopeptide repeat protein [Micromonosporaceae bacterium]|jgi:tetratricopeptide (TPR) repeat protein|nr:tetratricopeptide repeat protein [Micromonosporaceae bacterium]
MNTEFRLLGPLDVRVGDQVVAISSPKHRILLATLLLGDGHPVPVGSLVDATWGDAPPDNPRRTVQTNITRLRALLSEAGADGLIATCADGYRMDVAPDGVDLGRFRAGLACADHAADLDEEAAALADALAEWRGEPLADVPSDLLQREAAPRLREQRLRALERRIDVDLRRGRHGELIGELTTLTAQNPLRERLWAQLMDALYGSGRRADALAAYQTARRFLADELGIDPGEELQHQHATVLTGRSQPAGRQPAPMLPPVPRQLPPDARDFTGRAAELARLDALLVDAGRGSAGAVVISAIAGTAGVGKTALAVRWARRIADRFPDGQLWVNLRGYGPTPAMTAEQALTVLLRALGTPDTQIPRALDDLTGLYRSLVDGRRLLLVLDNANSPEQVRPLLPGAPGCLVVITSRDDLAGLVARDGAVRLRLDLLTQRESVALLRRLLGRQGIEAGPAALTSLAELCARLPLALRIAADRVAISGAAVPEVVKELAAGQRLDAFTAGGDPYTAVRAVFSWSYQALTPAAAGMFRLLGLIPGPDWDIYAATALRNCPLPEAEHLLGVLSRAHLVERRAGRFAMHDLLRAYAAERAEHDADREPAYQRLCDWYVHTARVAADLLAPHDRGRRPVPDPGTAAPSLADPASATAWLDAERENLVAIAGHPTTDGVSTCAPHLAGILHRYLTVGAHHIDALTIYRHALHAADATGDNLGKAVALSGLGTVYWLVGEFPKALDQYESALAIRRAIGDQIGEAQALGNLGIITARLGLKNEAFDYYQLALAIRRDIGDRVGEANVLGNLGIIYCDWAQYQQAYDHYQRALVIARDIKDPVIEAAALSNLGEIHRRWGQYDDAVELYRQALVLAQEIGDRAVEAETLKDLGTAHLRCGRYKPASEHYRRALALAREIGDRSCEAAALCGIASVHLPLTRYAEAFNHYQQALVLAREIGYRAVEIPTLNGLGAASSATGRPDDALSYHRSALDLAQQTGDRYEQAQALDGLSHAYRELGNHDDARRYGQRALALYAELGVAEAGEIRAAPTASAQGGPQQACPIGEEALHVGHEGEHV